jgi:3-hydroxyisobutyrate dehydrogenase-like beta-hydroxyacid dehydrogenase
MATLRTPIGFLGFGEAGFHLARGLRGAGAPPLVAFDIHADSGARGERIRSRAAETETRLVDGPQALAAAAPVIFSVVTASSALAAAEGVAPHLAAQHLYVDLNSVSPALKREIAAVVAAGGGRFVEAAIMAPVPGPDHRVPILLNGSWAPALTEILGPYGMHFDIMRADVGAAAAVKMCRSVVVKGLEALLLECTLVSRAYGGGDRVFDSLAETYPGLDWRKTADYMIGRVLQHGERRADEMHEVAETVRAAGLEPIMAEAIARRQDWEARLRETGRLTGAKPETVEAFLALLLDR